LSVADALLQVFVLPESRYNLREVAVGFGGPLITLAVADNFRVRHHPGQFLVPGFDGLKLLDQQLVCAHTESASSRALIAISTCLSSGGFVVIFCSIMPGSVTYRIRLLGCFAEYRITS